jgi:hypothetical protein
MERNDTNNVTSGRRQSFLWHYTCSGAFHLKFPHIVTRSALVHAFLCALYLCSSFPLPSPCLRFVQDCIPSLRESRLMVFECYSDCVEENCMSPSL